MRTSICALAIFAFAQISFSEEKVEKKSYPPLSSFFGNGTEKISFTSSVRKDEKTGEWVFEYTTKNEFKHWVILQWDIIDMARFPEGRPNALVKLKPGESIKFSFRDKGEPTAIIRSARIFDKAIRKTALLANKETNGFSIDEGMKKFIFRHMGAGVSAYLPLATK